MLRRDVVGPEPTSKERATAEKDFNNALADVNLSRVTAPFKPLARKPPLDALTFSTDGDLWVQRTTAAGAPHEADVYDKNGRMVAVAEWPTGFALMSYRTTIAGRTALAVAMDSLDVERVVRVRFK